MKQQEYIIPVKEGCEMKTAQMLDALGIELPVPHRISPFFYHLLKTSHKLKHTIIVYSLLFPKEITMRPNTYNTAPSGNRRWLHYRESVN